MARIPQTEYRKPKRGIRRKFILFISFVVLVGMAVGFGLGYFLDFDLPRDAIGLLSALTALLTVLVFLGYLFSGAFVRPILKLYKAIIEVSRGNLEYSLEKIKTNDEVEDCADSFRDMVSNTRAKQAEILEQYAYTETIISSMIDTLIVVDPDGAIKTVNQATLDLLGYAKKELIGQPVGMLFAAEEEFFFRRAGLRKLIRAGSLRNFDLTYVTKQGENIPVTFSGSVLRQVSCPNHDEPMDECPEFKKKGVHCEKVVGVIGVARDMRKAKKFISDLEKSKAKLQEWSKTLEEKVESRTKILDESREAVMNILEDIQEEKEIVEKQGMELAKAHKELKSFSKGLEEKVKERTTELSILYEVSNAISYTLDYQTLLKLIMESLFKIVDYDICASLLFDARTTNITLKPVYPGNAGFVNEVKNSLIDSTSTLTGENIRKKQLNTFLIPTNPDVKPKEERKFDEMRSFFNVPFVVRDKIIGMINVSSCKDNAFSEDDVKLIYTIANQASNAIERLQAVITAEKSKMESMVESMTEGVIMIDERSEVVVLNPQAKRMLGFGLTEEVASKALDGKMRRVGLYEAFQESQEKKRLIVKEIVIPGKESLVLRSDIAPVKNAEGEIIGIVTILRDVTKEKEIDRMKTEFISTVSHELRTPLTTMKEFTSIISDEIPGKLTTDQKEYVDIIKGNIDRLARLINNLLDISKIEAGRAELKKTLVDITNLASSVVSTLKPEAEGKHIEFKTVFPASKIDVYADPDKIVQAFTNLIGNAIKFTKENGKITVGIKDMEKEVEYSVADTGVGIASENLSELFTKFQQFGRTAGAGTKGTGLGLVITKELVELHNGRIWAESKPGKGSKFIFTLPKHTAEPLFKEYVDNGIKQAMKNDSRMSLIIVSLANSDELRQKLTNETVDSILKDMESVLRSSLRGAEGEAAIKGAGEVAAILVDCDKEDALRVEGRLKHILEDYLARKKLTRKIKLRFGRATYPDEARSAEDLIKKAKEM